MRKGPIPLPIEARLRRRSTVNAGGCWVWTGGLTWAGYGQIRVNQPRRHELAHRVAYELWVGPIPSGLELDHLCHNPPCINPDHLEPVTHAENMRRARDFNRARTPVCRNGHEWTLGNTGYLRGSRRCRACDRERYHRGKALEERKPEPLNPEQTTLPVEVTA